MNDKRVFVFKSGTGAYGFTGQEDGSDLPDVSDPWSFLKPLSDTSWQDIGLANEANLDEVLGGIPYIVEDPERIEGLKAQLEI